MMVVGAGGGAHGSDHESGGTDAIDGDHLDITYVPDAYTRSTTPPQADTTSHLTAHLNGIDTALSGRSTLSHYHYRDLIFNIDGGGAEIADNVTDWIQVSAAGTITAVTLLADQSGSIVVDIWVDSYANYPPTDADSITSITPPTISGATKATDTTLTDWSKDVSAGDIIKINVDSCTTIEKAVLIIKIAH